MNKEGYTEYVGFILPGGQSSTFCLSNPSPGPFGGTHDPQFAYLMPDGTGWRTEQEHLEYRGADGQHWITKCHAEYHPLESPAYRIWFSNGQPDNPDHDGEMPIIIDGEGKRWRITHPLYTGGERTGVNLVSYNE